jgi:hypothetical protein
MLLLNRYEVIPYAQVRVNENAEKAYFERRESGIFFVVNITISC